MKKKRIDDDKLIQITRIQHYRSSLNRTSAVTENGDGDNKSPTNTGQVSLEDLLENDPAELSDDLKEKMKKSEEEFKIKMEQVYSILKLSFLMPKQLI